MPLTVPPLFLIRAYDRQTRKGKNYDVPPVYLIGLMDVEVEHPDKEFWKNRFVSEYTSQPQWLQHEVYTRIFRACEIAGFTEEKLMKYEKEMYDEKRRNSEMNTARRIGYENGLKAGIREGHAEGRAVFYSPASILSARAGQADL